MKAIDSNKMTEVYIYVLQLTEGFYYVGKTQNVEIRYQQHRSGNGALWTRLHAPIRLVESYKTISMFEEDRKTKEVMAKYGINKVRGGTYTTEVLDRYTIEFLQKEIWTGQGCCGRCGHNDHYISECAARWNINGELIERMYYR